MPVKKGEQSAEDIEAKINEIIVEGGSATNVKMEVDYADTTDKKVPEAKDLAKAGKVDEALELLASLEKQTRQGGDMKSTAKILVATVNICFEAHNWTLLNEQVITLSKKRSQLKQAVAHMVRECFGYVEEKKLPSREVELKLIETLRTVTEGKIYVEVERARLTRRLAAMQEEDGDVEKAAKTMQELAVETYGSMERPEKVAFILEQMRLCLATQDYIRAQIISKKISTRFFEGKEEHQELKLKYYQYMIELDHHEGTYLNICRHYRATFDTPCIQADKDRKLKCMRHVALYIVLSKYDNEQSDLIHRILQEKTLEELPSYKSLLELFIKQELIDYARLCQDYENELRKTHDVCIFDNSELGKKRWVDLKNRVVEHNIRIISKYYSRIKLSRMSELLALDTNETEDFLSAMVTAGTVEAKTDRLEGVVSFKRRQRPNDTLNEWASNVGALMSKVEEATHLINKEEMVHRHMAGVAMDH